MMKTKHALLLAALLLSSAVIPVHSELSETDILYKSNDYFRSGDYEQRELVKRLNEKMDAEEMTSQPSAADIRYEQRREQIYQDAVRELKESE